MKRERVFIFLSLMLKGLFLLVGVGFGLAFAAENCISEFCQYKQFFENSTVNQENIQSNKTNKNVKLNPFPAFRIPKPPLLENTTAPVKGSNTQKTASIKTSKKTSPAKPVVPLKNIVVVKHSSAVVKVSLADMNRIVCPGELTGYAYSKEKLVKVVKSGNSLYVKFLPVKEWNPKKGAEELVYRDYPRDLFVECGGKTFSLILVPDKNLPSQEIYLQLPAVGSKKVAREFERAFPYEETLMRLIKYAYKDQIPPGYEVKFVGKHYKEFKELSLVLNKVFLGDRFRVLELVITAKKGLTLYEGMFIPYFPKAVAIAIEKPVLTRGEMTRLFVVENKD